MSRVYIENLGCAKNQVDAEVMGRRLEEAGYTWTFDADQADLILVNTCGFIEPAQQESIDTTLLFLDAYPDKLVALTGCMAQRFAEELVEGMPEVAGVFGNREPQLVPDFVRRVLERGEGDGPVIWLPEGRRDLTSPERGRLLSHPGSAYLKIAEGCEHNCSFCAIPSIRGRLRTRRSQDVLSEFRHLRGAGVHEFNLIAQDLAAWTEDDENDDVTGRSRSFTDLIGLLLEESGDFWLRPLYLYPDTFPSEILDIAAEDSRLLPYFDLSFQHASRSVLRRMGRPGDVDAYKGLIDHIREKLPDVALRSSFIVGFPGETEEDVEELARFIRAAQLEWVGVFEYSPQTGTPAASMEKPVPPRIAKARRGVIESIQEEIAPHRLSRFVGRELSVLVEERIEETAMVFGRSHIQAPDVDGLIVVHDCPPEVQAGSLVEVKITGVTGVDLQAHFLR